MNIGKIMKQMQKMQKDMQKTQAELAEKEIEASVGGGQVVVKANGAGEILSIKISPEVVDPEDVEILEDLVLSGVKQALEQSKEISSAEMGKVTAGLPIPPGMGF